ncbi:MAG: YcxB family protein [Chlorobi bacterium]|nr:YcxB family protein [Chlorobiota bacterium]
MEINIKLTRKDYINFNKYYYLKKAIKKRIIVVIIMAFGLPLIMNIGSSFYLFNYLYNVLLAGIIFGVIYLLLGYLLMNRTGKLPSDNGSILGERRFIITDEGLIEESNTHRSIQDWKGVKSIEENHNYLFIFVDNIAAYILPKRYFRTKEKYTEFVNEINKKMKQI